MSKKLDRVKSKKKCFVEVTKTGIVYKKLRTYARPPCLWVTYLATLQLLEGEPVYIGSDGVKGKCRTTKAKVLKIERLEEGSGWDDPAKQTGEFTAQVEHDCFGGPVYSILYTVGEVVVANGFSEESKECAQGIHFFVFKEEALKYW